MPAERLQKVLAAAGVASRRASENLIAQGRVTVDGRVAGIGDQVDPERSVITVDGRVIGAAAQHAYLLLHKPAGVVSSLRDPHAERTVTSLLPPGMPRLYPAGRLDRESEGLLLLTDDGELAERLLHPRYGVEREYAVLARGDLLPRTLARLRRGAEVEGARVAPAAVEVRFPPAPIGGPVPPGARWLRITLTEGRKREVRVLCAAAGLHVLRLIRVRFGPLHLGDLPLGHTRPLTPVELTALREPQRHVGRKGRREFL
ncbi:MAG: pseudouridine synthase [Dehalococcoidia bacterium]